MSDELSYVDPHDYPRDVICEMADEVVANSEVPVDIYFKSSCPHCSERCTFQEPNKLYEFMECHKCGQDFPVFRAGFALIFHFNKPKDQ